MLLLIGAGIVAALFARSIAGRQPLPFGLDDQGGRATDSPQAVVPVALETPADPVAGTAQPSPVDPVEGAAAAATKLPEPPAPDVSTGDAALKTEFTELVVTSQPPGARVTVDGIGWGSAPVSIRFLPAGSKRIRVIRTAEASGGHPGRGLQRSGHPARSEP